MARRLLSIVPFLALAAFLLPSSDGLAPDPRLRNSARLADRNGWIQVKLAGTPRQIGFQHGYHLAPEIQDARRVVGLSLGHDSNRDWAFFREAAKNTFWPKVPAEYREEIEGISEGLKARGVNLDIYDLTAMNAFLETSPYYLTWYERTHGEKRTPAPVAERCSAFVATGSWTADGKPVIGHNNWSGYLEASRWNIIFDITPEHGHRILMDGFAGLIHSGDDFGINSAGLMITETTISQFNGFDPNGIPEFVRARQAMQYAASIDDYVRIMKQGNNGGYANTWLIADRNTGEIASLELGLKNVTLQRSRDGYFIGSNFPANEKLIREETSFNPTDLSVSANARRARWEQIMKEYKGRINVAAGQRFLADHHDTFTKQEDPGERTLCGHIDLSPRGLKPWQSEYGPAGTAQSKATDAAMAGRMTLTAAMGHACGLDFRAAEHLKKHPEFAWQGELLRDLPARPWTEFTASK